MTIYEKMHGEALYLPNDEKLAAEQLKTLEKLYDCNSTRPSEQEKRAALLKDMFAEIGKNCWIGAGAIILPGVTIGENSVIGAGSIVTKDVSPNVVTVGNPCRTLRPISDKDKEFCFKNHKINYSEL